MSDTDAPNDEHPNWHQGVATAAIIKITATGSEVLYTFEFPESDTSHTPNILRYDDRYIYVTNLADDHDKYMESLYRALEAGDEQLLEGGAWLDMYKIDTWTDTVIKTDSYRPDFETHPLVDRGYGKSNPVMDAEHGRIYALFNGGTVPGYIAWFVYDIATDQWVEECFTIELTSRRDYFNAYPDGNGGMTFICQRNNHTSTASEMYGIEWRQGYEDTYVWDGVYIYNVPDVFKEEYVEHIVKVAEYSQTEPNTPQQITFYGYGGCSYRDFDGNIHIIYSHNYTGVKVNTYHAIYDSFGNEIYNELIEFSQKQGSGTNNFSFAMTQGPSGKYYIIASRQNARKSYVEVWSSDDGINFDYTVERYELTLPDGSSISGGKLSISNSRPNSIMDGIVPLVYDTENFYYCTFVLELP